MNCRNCAAAMVPVGGAAYFRCGHCGTFEFPTRNDDGIADGGCGRTVSVWIAHKIRRLSLGTRNLRHFLRRVATDSLADAVRDTSTHPSERILRRIATRFHLARSRIRTALCPRCPPPTGPPDPGSRPILAEVLAHLRAAFPHADCPLAAYQWATGTFVL